MNKGYCFIYILLCCVLLSFSAGAQSKYDVVFDKDYAERAKIFDTVVMKEVEQLDFDEFQVRMTKLEEKAKKKKDYGVQLEIIMARSEYRNKHDLTNADETIAMMEKLLAGLDKKKYPEYAALIMFDLGNNYFSKKFSYTKAFENYINSYNVVKEFNSVNFPHKKNVLANIGTRYYSIGDHEKAKEILLESDTLPDSRIQITNYNNKNTLGLIYRYYGQYDSAITYFEQTRQLAAQGGSEVWENIAKGNIGICYYQQGKYDMAIPMLKDDVTACLKHGPRAYDNALNSQLILADIHLKMDSMNAVAEDIKLVNRYIDASRDKIKVRSMLYPVLSKYHYKKGDLGKAYAYQDSAAVYKDSLSKRDNIYLLAKVEHKKELEKHEAELEVLHAEKRLMEFTRNGLIGGIALLGVITALTINRQKLRHKIRQNALIASQELARQELMNATTQLESYTKRLQEKNAIIEKSTREIEKLQATLTASQQGQVNDEALQQLHASTILTDEEWDEFKALFEQVHKGFLVRLKDKMPGLSPADTRFIVLSKLKLNNKEMAGILGVQPDSIRSNKHRLRKKFNLPDDNSITDFVDAI